MNTYVAGRGSGKTMLSVINAAEWVSSGSEVYIVSPSKSQCDYTKKLAVKIAGKEVADKIHYITGSEVLTKKIIGMDTRKSTKIIFDDLDYTLNQITKETFGVRSEIELVTATLD